MRPPIGSDRHDHPNGPEYDDGRHWPITYLHREPPPNCTDSLASADDSGNRRANETLSIVEVLSSSTTVKSAGSSTTTVKNAGSSTMSNNRARRLQAGSDRREMISSRKIGLSRMVMPRAAKVERVSRPTTEGVIQLTVASLANNVEGMVRGQ
jgi:hypothetical protein